MNISKNTKEKKERLLTGTVVSNRMKDTVVVLITRYRKHPKYGKFLLRSKRIKAHDAGNTCAMGDMVTIKETHPISKDKHFKVMERLTPQVQKEELQSEALSA